MSRRATGFKYVPGRSAELKQFEAFPSNSYRSLTSLISNSSDCSLAASRHPVDFDSNLHLQPLSKSFRQNEACCRGGEELQMMPRGVGGGGPLGGGGSGDRRGSRDPGRRGSGGLPSMVWSSDRLSVSQLAEDFAITKRLPVIAKVTQGYYGDGRLKLPVGQVLQIYATCEELRVRASDGSGRQLSLPFSEVQSMDVRWNDNNSGPHRQHHGTANNVGTTGCSGYVKLGDVLREATLPVTVSVPKMSTQEEDSSRWNDLSICSFPLGTQLTVQSIYKCSHLLANVIENGWLDSSSILTIPEDLRPHFRVALGLKDATPDEWKDFTGMFDRAARHIKFSGVKGYNGVIYEDWSEFSMTCEPEADESSSSPKAATPLVEIERYLINKKQLPQSSSSSSSSLTSPPSDNNNIDHVKRFPKTSPFLGNRRTVFGSSCSSSSSSFSVFPAPPASATAASGFASPGSESLSSLDSVGIDRLSSRTVSGGTSGASGPPTEVLPRMILNESIEPDYANVREIHAAREVPSTKGLSAGGQHSGLLPQGKGTSSNPQRNDALARVEDIALEDLSVAGQVVKCGSTTGDNRGTLNSIDEGYSTKDSSRSSTASDAATLATSAKKRYSPVYF